ncbi:DUF5017 domain-containing protein [Proteiniphilum sp. X52]|uniref:DUF5017 domain-containing protein n=1 Tax=Proteiniphilum sp. X52 TaxID=2382159 RepID=UPI000F09CE14|nr:DUF5017 domain-containing protein [Proteiniphilum sp. X52]RNC67039.1 DUF5017 domain-containing protein [Proteiniphilum sp. X52]
MKAKYLLIGIGFVGVLLSCSERLGDVEQPEFTVSVDKTTFEVGEEVVFKFTGAPSIISFYSGEPGNNYLYKDEGRLIQVADAGATMSFSTQMVSAPANCQTNQLAVLYSTDYNGNDNYADIVSAHWTDVSDQFTLATGTSSVASGERDITSYFSGKGPVYIGFRYTTKPQNANKVANPWYVTNFTVKSLVDPVDGADIVITDYIHAGFRIIDQYPEEAPSRSYVNSTRITFSANLYRLPTDSLYDENDPWNDPETVTWAISKPIYKDTVRLAKDWASAIKGINADEMESYSYQYNTPGTYKAYFVAVNSTIDNVKYTVREVEITIVEP